MRILFVSNPLHGHLNTLLPLALAAQRAGHDVVLASGPDMQQHVQGRGLAAWPVGPTHAQMGGSRQTSWLDYFARSAAGRAFELLARTDEWKPDLVIHEDTEFAGALVAVRRGARHFVHGLGLMPSADVWAGFGGRIDELGRDFGVSDLSEHIRNAVYLHICPPALAGRGEQVWRRSLPLRHCAGTPADGERLPDAINALPYRETIHLTLGTVFHEATDVLLSAVAGLRELPYNLVVTIGPGADRALFGPQPAHILLEPYLPHTLLLPRCCLVVSHGGAGAMLGALTHGLPQLLLPQGGDQFVNARACQHTGVALVLSAEQLSPASVGDAGRRLLNEASFKRAAEAVQAEIAGMPNAEELLPTLTA
jgi:UDP:flavonoid glycosyltransferase YjiC (YdhE family)